MFLEKEDYEEPCCPLNKPGSVSSIPIRRIIERLDEYLSHRDYDGAVKHLRYWLAEAEAGNDSRGKLSILNEQIGLYRKIGEENACLQSISAALAQALVLDLDNTITLGTTYLNAATGLKAFGKAAEALPLYEKARPIYETNLAPNDERLGGLYNNMALTVMELGDFRKAEKLFMQALDIMAHQEHGEAEMAITYINLADLTAAEYGMEIGESRINELLQKAEQLLNTDSLPRNGYYAFVCEKCAPAFGYYGFCFTEQELMTRAREIYERT